MGFRTLFHFCILFALLGVARAETPSRVVIVGGGIAGLTTLHELQKKGIPAELYELSGRLGGRIRTVENVLGSDLISDAGAELVDSQQTAMISLARELEVPVIPSGTRTRGDLPARHYYLFSGRVFSEAQLFDEIFRTNRSAIHKLGMDSRSFREGDAAFMHRMDRMTASQYLARIGADRLLLDYIRAGVETDYGAQLDQLSALVVLDAFVVDLKQRKIEFLPDHDEAFRIEGGTQKVIETLERRSGSPIFRDHTLSRIRLNRDGTYTAMFRTGSGRVSVTSDQVVLAVPFFQLQDVRLPAKIRRQIPPVTYSKTSKIALLFTHPTWDVAGPFGWLLSGMKYQLWDSGHFQSSDYASLKVFVGDHEMLNRIGHEGFVKQVLAELELIFPGISRTFLGSHIETWPASFAAADRPGEYTRLTPAASPHPGFFWAGDFFGYADKGYMESAVRSARAAAEAIAAEKCGDRLARTGADRLIDEIR